MFFVCSKYTLDGTVKTLATQGVKMHIKVSLDISLKKTNNKQRD